MLSNEIIEFLREERNRHIDELTAIDVRINETIKRYQQAVNVELDAINNINGIFEENDVPLVDQHNDSTEGEENE